MAQRPSAPAIAVARLLLVALLPLVALPGEAGAHQAPGEGEPLATDRPDFTEGTATVEPGRFQVESGYTFERSGEEERHSIGEMLVRVGVARGLEARVGVNSFAVVEERGASDRGFEDLSLGGKLRLWAGGGRLAPELSLLAGASLPTGADGIGAEEVEPEALIAAAVELSERLALGANLGYRNRTGAAGRVDEPFGSLALGVGMAPRVGAFLETFALWPLGSGEPDAAFLDAGVTLLLGPDAQLDARAGVGIDEPEPSYFLGLGLSLRR